ncbi:hypothetical protein NM688_g2976 [Phlebia brevispora]|uniref:Uncharacterized protein n=1 Tax=Phlebia brevispora TaxID=194682 RepID=A0ACC1T7A3_9APHY|nr:hypothetical protein NM688_g2976 [Phlebia brevispora]
MDAQNSLGLAREAQTWRVDLAILVSATGTLNTLCLATQLFRRHGHLFHPTLRTKTESKSSPRQCHVSTGHAERTRSVQRYLEAERCPDKSKLSRAGRILYAARICYPREESEACVGTACVIVAEAIVQVGTWTKSLSARNTLRELHIQQPLVGLLLRDGTAGFMFLSSWAILLQLVKGVQLSSITVPGISIVICRFLLRLRQVYVLDGSVHSDVIPAVVVGNMGAPLDMRGIENDRDVAEEDPEDDVVPSLFVLEDDPVLDLWLCFCLPNLGWSEVLDCSSKWMTQYSIRIVGETAHASRISKMKVDSSILPYNIHADRIEVPHIDNMGSLVQTSVRHVDRSLVISVTTLQIYDHLLTFESEVRCIWRRAFSGATVIFLTMRYIPLIHAVFAVIQEVYCSGSSPSCSTCNALSRTRAVTTLFPLIALGCGKDLNIALLVLTLVLIEGGLSMLLLGSRQILLYAYLGVYKDMAVYGKSRLSCTFGFMLLSLFLIVAQFLPANADLSVFDISVPSIIVCRFMLKLRRVYLSDDSHSKAASAISIPPIVVGNLGASLDVRMAQDDAQPEDEALLFSSDPLRTGLQLSCIAMAKLNDLMYQTQGVPHAQRRVLLACNTGGEQDTNQNFTALQISLPPSVPQNTIPRVIDIARDVYSILTGQYTLYVMRPTDRPRTHIRTSLYDASAPSMDSLIPSSFWRCYRSSLSVMSYRRTAATVQFCATCLLFYDYFLTLPDEVRVMWKRKPSKATITFCFLRYGSLLSSLAWASQFGFSEMHNYIACEAVPLLVIKYSKLLFTRRLAFCCLRAYTLSLKNATVAAFIAMLFLAYICINAYAVASGTFFPYRSTTFGCYEKPSDSYPLFLPNAESPVYIGMACAILAELIVQLLTWMKIAWIHKTLQELNMKRSVTTLLLRDGSMLFSFLSLWVIMSEILFGGILTFANPIVISVMLCRFMLRFRQCLDTKVAGSVSGPFKPSFVVEDPERALDISFACGGYPLSDEDEDQTEINGPCSPGSPRRRYPSIALAGHEVPLAVLFPVQNLRMEADNVSYRRAVSYVQFSAMSLLFYDYLLTLPEEICVIWKRRFTWTTVTFSLLRYGSLLSSLVWTSQLALPQVYASNTCDAVKKVAVIVDTIQYTGLGAFCCLRAYALSNKDSRLTGFVATLFLAYICINAVCIPASTLISLLADGILNHPHYAHLRFCDVGMGCGVVAELVVQVLTWVKTANIYKTIKHLNMKPRGSTLLLRDGLYPKSSLRDLSLITIFPGSLLFVFLAPWVILSQFVFSGVLIFSSPISLEASSTSMISGTTEPSLPIPDLEVGNKNYSTLSTAENEGIEQAGEGSRSS